jgi:threonine dehydrogenase-like Zn-dependent dehydrogenase
VTLALEYTAKSRLPISRPGWRRPLRLVERRVPPLPDSDWVVLRPRLAGISDLDLRLVSTGADGSPEPVLPRRFVPGHEIVGDIDPGADGARRVVVDSTLACRVRGVAYCPDCENGAAPCRHVGEGRLRPALRIGRSADTGGGWSEGLVVHSSQAHSVPDDLTDEDCVLIEQLAWAANAVARAEIGADDVVAVIGAGSLGCLTVAVARRQAPDAVLVFASGSVSEQQRARELGADCACSLAELSLRAAEASGGRRLLRRDGRPLLLGGVDAAIDCTCTAATVRLGFDVTRPRGRFVLAMAPAEHADLTSVWRRELSVRGAAGAAGHFDFAIELAASLRPGRLVGDAFALRDHERALGAARAAIGGATPRIVFDLRPDE